MKTSQASFRQKNPQAIINSLLAYLCTHDSYYLGINTLLILMIILSLTFTTMRPITSNT